MAAAEPPVEDGIREYPLDSWKAFLYHAVDKLTKAPAYIYRGQANWQWQTTSTLDRLEQRFPKRKNLSDEVPQWFDVRPLNDEEHLRAFRRAIRGRRGRNPSELNEDGYWAMGQHYGLATRLLDWTRSPFFALFFAFEEERIRDGDKYVAPTHRAVLALSTSVWPQSEPDSNDTVRFISPAEDENLRLISQGGILVRLPRKKSLEECVREDFKDQTRRPVLTKFRIPNGDGQDRHDCLIALSKMGINRMTLFPDIGGAADYVNSLWEPGHEELMPYL